MPAAVPAAPTDPLVPPAPDAVEPGTGPPPTPSPGAVVPSTGPSSTGGVGSAAGGQGLPPPPPVSVPPVSVPPVSSSAGRSSPPVMSVGVQSPGPGSPVPPGGRCDEPDGVDRPPLAGVPEPPDVPVPDGTEAGSDGEVTRSLFETARQYIESFDVYADKVSFEWPSPSSTSKPCCIAAKRPSA